MPIERSKRNRENASESETQGRGDTVKHFNQEHTTKEKKQRTKINVKWKTKKGKKHFGNHFSERQEKKKRRYVSQCAVPKMEVVCKQEIINRGVRSLCNMVCH